MRQTFLFTLTALTLVAITTGCSGKMPYAKSDNTEECSNINKNLGKIDKFIEVVNNASAFHLEELASTVPETSITESNNKPRMLRDANAKKQALLTEHQKLGCEPLKNK